MENSVHIDNRREQNKGRNEYKFPFGFPRLFISPEPAPGQTTKYRAENAHDGDIFQFIGKVIVFDEDEVHDFIDQPSAGGEGRQCADDSPFSDLSHERAGCVGLDRRRRLSLLYHPMRQG